MCTDAYVWQLKTTQERTLIAEALNDFTELENYRTTYGYAHPDTSFSRAIEIMAVRLSRNEMEQARYVLIYTLRLYHYLNQILEEGRLPNNEPTSTALLCMVKI
jgi:hypothetical protein